jgi:hypothetical protein
MTLLTLFKSILNHQANDAKASEQTVKLAYDNFKNDREYNKSALSQLSDKYAQTYEGPRNTREAEYNTYVSGRATAHDNWKSSKLSGDFHTYASIRIPKELLKPVPNVFTKHILPNDL